MGKLLRTILSVLGALAVTGIALVTMGSGIGSRHAAAIAATVFVVVCVSALGATFAFRPKQHTIARNIAKWLLVTMAILAIVWGILFAALPRSSSGIVGPIALVLVMGLGVVLEIPLLVVLFLGSARRTLTVLAATCVAALGVTVWHCTAPTFAELETQGQSIIEAVRTYQGEHGRCPASLQEAGIPTPWTRYGRWEYGVSEDGSQCFLHLGDYGKDLFEMGWSSKDGKWWYDT